jgi:hypothetical protein
MQRLIAAFLTCQLLGGCSFAFVKGPPKNHRDLETVDCSISNAAPILDTLWTGLEMANFVSASGSSDEEWDAKFDGSPPMSRGAAMPFYMGLAVLSGASMIYGYMKAADCRRAKSEAQERMASWRRRPNPDEEPTVPRATRAPAAASVAPPMATSGHTAASAAPPMATSGHTAAATVVPTAAPAATAAPSAPPASAPSNSASTSGAPSPEGTAGH